MLWWMRFRLPAFRGMTGQTGETLSQRVQVQSKQLAREMASVAGESDQNGDSFDNEELEKIE